MNFWKGVFSVSKEKETKRRYLKIFGLTLYLNQGHKANFPPVHPWLGRHSYYCRNFSRANPNTTIGAFCSIGSNVAIGPSQHPTNWLSTSPVQYSSEIKAFPANKLRHFKNKPTFVGNDVWIGNNVIVQDGITVGDGAIIGSNAVVTKDVPPYAIVGGVPAKIIKYRFSEDIITDLLTLKWWDLSDEQIAELPFDDIHGCIQKLKEIRQVQ